MTGDDDFEKERQFWLQHIQQLDDYTFHSKETKPNDSQLHSTHIEDAVNIAYNDHEETEEFEVCTMQRIEILYLNWPLQRLSLSKERFPALDPSFATDEKITLQRVRAIVSFASFYVYRYSEDRRISSIEEVISLAFANTRRGETEPSCPTHSTRRSHEDGVRIETLLFAVHLGRSLE